MIQQIILCQTLKRQEKVLLFKMSKQNLLAQETILERLWQQEMTKLFDMFEQSLKTQQLITVPDSEKNFKQQFLYQQFTIYSIRTLRNGHNHCSPSRQLAGCPQFQAIRCPVISKNCSIFSHSARDFRLFSQYLTNLSTCLFSSIFDEFVFMPLFFSIWGICLHTSFLQYLMIFSTCLFSSIFKEFVYMPLLFNIHMPLFFNIW